MIYTALIPRLIGATTVLAQCALARVSISAARDGYHDGSYSYIGYPQADDALASFIASETPIALQGILDNIGPDGKKVAGAGSGLVIASPSTVEPNCKLPQALTPVIYPNRHRRRSCGIENVIIGLE